MIKKFLQFLFETKSEMKIQDTTTILTENETEKFLLDKLKQNPKYFDNIVYRGIAINQDYIKVDYTNFTRKSAYLGYNHLNLILSNDERFKDFNKRDKSLICTTYKAKANTYSMDSTKSGVYVIIPIEYNPIFTYINKSDLFEYFSSKYQLQYWKRRLCLLLLNEYGITLVDDNYSDYKKIVNNFDLNCLDNSFEEQFKKNVMSGKYFGFDELKNMGNNLSELIDCILKINILKNSFFNINYLDIHTIKNENYEIWTEAPCILLNTESELAKKYIFTQ